MPRPPKPASAVLAMPGQVYAPTAREPAAPPVPAIPLNVGDTWLEPCEAARMQDLDACSHPDLHRYGPTRGVPALLEAILEKLRDRNQVPCERGSILVTAGATGALACAVAALTEPGEEVLILAPFWPLIRGAVQAFRAQPVEVPFYDRVDSTQAAVAAIEERISPRSAALYVSTPSNPTGRVLPQGWLEALAELARRHDLWLLSDEVYEDYVYRGEHVSLARFAPERTLSAFSFSKSYGMAGHRVGYLVGPREIVDQAEKVGVHTFYHAPVAGQVVALRALAGPGPAWQARAAAAYRAAGEDAARRLGVPAPQGSTFLFVDASAALDGRGLAGFLADCAEQGVLLAPGHSSGADYGSFVRLCYTAAPSEQVAAAVDRVARLLGR